MPPLEQLISRRFAAPAWAIFYEVANGTGFGGEGRRYADAVAIGIWPSRGHAVHGFEIKRSRSDWARERDDPTKADAVSKWCDFWWLVAADRSICPLSELPETWGLMVPRGESLVTVKDAPKRDAEPLSSTFVAACLRRIAETTISKTEHESTLEAEVAKRLDSRVRSMTRALEQESTSHDALKKSVDEFEEASGLRLGGWPGGRQLGEAVRAYAARTHVTGLQRLEQAKRDLETIITFVDADIRAMAALDVPLVGVAAQKEAP